MLTRLTIQLYTCLTPKLLQLRKRNLRADVVRTNDLSERRSSAKLQSSIQLFNTTSNIQVFNYYS